MTTRRQLSAALAVILLPLCAGPASADDREWERAEKTIPQRIADAGAALPSEGLGKKLAELAENASTDRGALAELYRTQDEYVARIMAEWRDGPDRKAMQDASGQMLRSAERVGADLRAATDAADAAAIRMRHSGVLEKIGNLEAAAKDAGTRLAGRWERERLMREREREQREREAGERARDQRR